MKFPHIFAGILACTLSTTSFAKYPAGDEIPRIDLDKSRWMTQGYAGRSNMRLRNICIPGSHDTGTYSITNGIDENISQTQYLNVHQQLAQGYRYFDLRFKIIDGEWKAFHGPSVGAPLSEIGPHLKDFVEKNPREILLLKLLSEGSPAQREDLYHILKGYVGDRMANRSFGNDVTFEELWAADKNVIMMWTAGDWGNHPDLWPFYGTIIDPWANRTNINGLINHQLDKADDPRNGAFFVHQLIRTPLGRGGSWTDDATDFFETADNEFSVQKLTRGLNATAMVYMVDKQAKSVGMRANIAMVDFIEDHQIFEACMDLNDLEENWFKIQSTHYGTCLRADGIDDGASMANGHGVHHGSCDNYTGANWRYIHATDQLISGKWGGHGGFCLDTSGTTYDGTQPHIWQCQAGNGNQQFVYESEAFKHKHSPLSLDAWPAGQMGMWHFNYGPTEKWRKLHH